MKRLLWSAIPLVAFAAGVFTGWEYRGTTPPPALPAASVRPAEAKPVAATPRASLAEVLGVLNTADRNTRLRSLAEQEAARDPLVAWVMHRDIAGVADREEFCLTVLRIWAAQNYHAAVEAAAALPPGRLHTACIAAALEAFAAHDVAGAIALAQSLQGAAREAAFTAITGTWAAQDAPAAAQWAWENLSVPGTAGSLRAAVEAWADINPAAASQWVAGLPPGDAASAALSALVETWAEQTPAEAAAWISAQGVHDALDAPAAALAARWAASSPRDAANWAITLPRTLTARSAAAQAIGEWAAADPQSAAAWVQAQSGSQPKIAAALHESLAASWAAQDPSVAASWAASVADPYLQHDAAVRVFNTWAATDPAGLEAWLARNPDAPAAASARDQLARSTAP